MAEVTAVQTTPEPPLSLWTREILVAAKASNRIVLRFLARPEGAPSFAPQKVLVEFVREEQKREGEPYRAEQRLSFEFEGFIRAGYGNEVGVSRHPDYGDSHHYSNRSYKPDQGVWSSALYFDQGGHTETALTLLPIGAKVQFEVGLDRHSNGYMAKARIHGDVLIAKFQKGNLKGDLEIDSTYIEHNSARFGFGR